jgi:ABC-2 type transport system ATP-binding protein
MTLAAHCLTVRLGGRTVLGPLDLTVAPGITALVGRNGAGKTTLLRTLVGLLTPAAGRVCWHGRTLADAAHLRAFRTKLGYVPQDFSAYPQLTVAGFVAHVAAMKGLGPRAQAAAAAAMQQLGLGHLAGVRPAALSTGQLRLVALAQAIVADPDVLILDEPLRGLAADTRQHVAAWLHEWVTGRSERRTVILSAHGPDLDHVAARWVLLDGGRVACDGDGSELIHASYGRVWDVLAAGPANALAALQRRPGPDTGCHLLAVAPRGREWRLRIVLTPGAGEALLRQWLTPTVQLLTARPLPAGAEAAYLMLQADRGTLAGGLP